MFVGATKPEVTLGEYKGLKVDKVSNRVTAKEVDEKALPIKIGLLSPGIMITDFITHSMGNDAFELPEKTKKVYNILGDYPDVIAEFLVSKIITNDKNDVRFNWLTNGKASLRFMMAAFNKRDFFNSDRLTDGK